MAHTVHDPAGKPVAVILDAEEIAYIVPVLHRLQLSRTLPPVVLGALAALELVAARWQPSVDGHVDDAATSETSVDGREGVTPDDIAGILDSKAVAELLGVTERQGRRQCEQIGMKVGGRWFAHRADVERKRA